LVFWRAVVLVSRKKLDVGYNEKDEGTEGRGAFEQVIRFREGLNIEIVGSDPEDLMFDSALRSDMMGSLTPDASPTGAGRIRNPGIMLVARGAGIL